MKDALRKWNVFKKKLSPHHDVLWLFDLDGTLAPIAEDPSRTRLEPQVRSELEALMRRFPGRVGVLSGRPVSEVKRVLKLGPMLLGGTHGFEIRANGDTFDAPDAIVWKPRLRTLRSAFTPVVKQLPGVWIEKKPWTLCLHYRQARKRDEDRVKVLLHDFQQSAEILGFRTQEGLKTLEALPRVPWNKGMAAAWMMKKSGATKLFYAGDDTTDEFVFRKFGHHATVLIGRKTSGAGFYLRDQKHMPEFLRKVNSL